MVSENEASSRQQANNQDDNDDEDDDDSSYGIDGDFVWELADSIRWLARAGKDRFKIERFLFDELCPAYESRAPRLVRSLLQELGYAERKREQLQKTTPKSVDRCAQTSIPATSSSSLVVANTSDSSKSFSVNVNMVSEAIRSILESNKSTNKKKNRKNKKK